MSAVRPWATISAAAVVLLAVVVLALTFAAAPASAYSQWQHDGATGCVCHTIASGTPTDATCATCHSGFQSYPGKTCWSCHAPGQDTSTLSSPSSACSQECHLWNATQKQYITPTTHGTNPHLGSTTACLDCHPTSVSWNDPGVEPAPSGHGSRLHRVRRVPLVAAEARRQGRVRQLSHQRHGVPPVPGQQPRVQAVRLLPLHEARRQEGADQQVRQLPQGHRRPAGAALVVGHQEVRLRRLPQQQAARAGREQGGQELPHLPHRQVPRSAAHAGRRASAPSATRPPRATPTASSARCATGARSTPRDPARSTEIGL